MPEPITIGTIIGGILSIAMIGINSALSIMQHFGYPPFALFMIAMLYYDIQQNWIGGAITTITDFFFHFRITSFVLFMFVIFTLIVWVFWKVRQFHASGAYSR